MRISTKLIPILLLTSSLLAACGNDLWGNYDPYLTQTSDPVEASLTATSEPTATPTPLPPTPTPTNSPTATATPQPSDTPTPTGPTPTAGQMIVYTSQSGDSLAVVAIHFGVAISEITAQVPLPSTGFIDPGIRLIIPNRVNQATTPDQTFLPDSEVVYSPSTVDFDVESYVNKAGGKLSTYREYLVTYDWTTGAQDVQRIAFESSINPRLLLALIQYWGGWVQGEPFPSVGDRFPLGQFDEQYQGLYEQMRWAIQQLSTGYYGWRSGRPTRITFLDGTSLRIAPGLNAGTVALMVLFAQRYPYSEWLKVIDPQGPFMQLYASMFGDPFQRAATVGPLFPPGLNQPDLILPFEAGRLWSFTGGPHPGWGLESALAALDFAPASDQSGCYPTDAWVLASAPGRVVRSARLRCPGPGRGRLRADRLERALSAHRHGRSCPPGSMAEPRRSRRASLLRGGRGDRHPSSLRSQIQRRVGGGRRTAALRSERLDGSRRECLLRGHAHQGGPGRYCQPEQRPRVRDQAQSG